MKVTTFLLLTITAFANTALSQETADASPQKKEKPQMAPWQKEFSNLSVEKRREYFSLAQEANSLFKDKRIFECLDTLAKLKAIFPDNPGILNLEGACFVEFRDFDKAREIFKKALAESPGNPNVKFNLAEVDFVTHNWKAAEKSFMPILDELKGRDESMHNLVLYKLALCKIKLGKVDEAKKLIEPYDFLDDSPIFYYGKAALAYEQDQPQKAEAWLARASRVFRDPQILAPWQDTLIEFGYLKSFYGGDLEGDEQALPGTGADAPAPAVPQP